MPDLSSSPSELLAHAQTGDLSDNGRSNLKESLMILEFQLLIEQAKAARAQKYAAIGTFFLFAATIALVIVTAA